MQPQVKKFNGIFSVVILLLCCIFWQSHLQPDSKVLEQQETSLGFSPQNTHQILQRLFKDMPAHPMGSAANDMMRERLTAELHTLGYTTQVTTDYFCSAAMNCGYVTNLIGYLNEPSNNNAVLLNVHYDSVVSGPGVADNGANLANALEIARLYKEQPGQNPLVILFSDGEEVDALGSGAFVLQPLAKKIATVVNLEARGTSGRSLMFETSAGSAPLIELLGENFTRVKTSSVFAEVYNYLPNQSDFTNFSNSGIAGYNFAFIGSSENYHTIDDSLDSLNAGSMIEQGTAAWSVILALSQHQDIQSIPLNQDVVFYTDLAGSTLLSWSPNVSVIFVVIAFFLTIFIFFFGDSNGHRRIRIVGGALAVALCTILGVAACYAVMVLIVTLQPVELPWNNYPFQSHVVIWVLSVAMAGVIYDTIVRKWNLFEQLGGIVVYFSLMALILTLLAPGASYLYLLPVLPSIGLLTLYKLTNKYWLLLCAAALLVVVYALLAIDLSYLIEQAMALGAIGMILPLFLAPIGISLVVLANASVLERNIFRASYVVAALSFIVGLVQIGQQIAQPVRQIANFIHFQNDEVAYKQLGVSLARLAPALKASFDFKSITEEVPMYKRYPRTVIIPVEKRQVQRFSEVEQSELLTGERQLTVRIAPAAVHHYIKLKLPADLVVNSLQVNGEKVLYEVKNTLDAEGFSVLTFYGDVNNSSEIKINYNAPLNKDYMMIDEEVSDLTFFSDDKLYAEYQKHYAGQNKGNRSIYQYKTSL